MSWYTSGRARLVAALTGTAVVGALLVPAAIASSAPPPAPAPSAGPRSGELPELRTRTSRTYVNNGRREVRVYPAPVNYQDATGAWQPIDETLVATSGGGWHNAADAYRLDVPPDLATAPVRVSAGQDWLSFALRGAAGAPAIAANAAEITNALPGVTLGYTAGSGRAKETITLASPAAAGPLVFDVTLSNGLAMAADGPAIDVSRAGQRVFGLQAPFMVDAAGVRSDAVAMTEVPTAGGYTVAVTPDPTWLAAPGRAWPAVIDPTVTIGASTDPDCSLSQANPNTSTCSANPLTFGWNGTAATRLLLNFADLQNAMFWDETIESATLNFDVTAVTNGNAATAGAYQLTHSWTTAATWNKYDGTNAWTTAGGDFASPAPATTSVSSTGWKAIAVPSLLVQGWLNGTTANNGLLVKETTENVSNTYSVATWQNASSSLWPYLSLTYDPSMGEMASYPTLNHRLTDHSTISVNLASGNLELHSSDMHLTGTGLDLALDHVVNSQDAGNRNPSMGWGGVGIADIALNISTLAVVLHMPTGTALVFNKSGSSWTPPAGLDGQLSLVGSVYTVTFNKSQTKWNFTTCTGGCGLFDAVLTSTVDANANTVTLNRDSANAYHLTSIVDTQGRTITATYKTGTGQLNSFTDNTGRAVSYGYDDPNNFMTTYTDGDGKVTHYVYDPTYNTLTSITDPVGNQTTFVYNDPFEHGRVTSITYGATTPQAATWMISYGHTDSPSGRSTTVTDPNSHVTTYYYDNFDRTTKVLDALGHNRQSTYSADNQPATITDGLSAVTNLSYDTNNNLSQLLSPPSASGQTGATTKFAYNTSGKPYLASSQTDAQANCNAYKYDPAGNLTTVYSNFTPVSGSCDVSGSPPSGSVTMTNAYQGDSGVPSCGGHTGQLCSTTDAKGTTTYAYTYAGSAPQTLTQLVVTQPAPLNTHPTTTTFDALTRVATVTDGKGQVTRYSHDGNDRITQVLYNGATTCTSTATCITYTYDADGNLIKRTDNTGPTSYSYDPLNRPTRISDYATVVMADTPSAYWRLGESSGTAATDSSGNGRTGTYSGGFTLGQAGAIAGDADKAASFDGVNGQVSVPDDTTMRLNASWSIEFWAKQNSLPGSFPGILGKGDSTTANGYIIYYDSTGKLSFKRNNLETTTTTGQMHTDALHHYAVTYDGTNLRWYVDGILNSTTARSYPTNAGTNALTLAKADQYGSETLDEVSFYASALSTNQVAQHYSAGSQGLTYGYDGADNLTSTGDADGTSTYYFDAANRNVGMAKPGGSCTSGPSFCISFGYDNNGRRTLSDFPTSPVVSQAIDYDGAGNVKTMVARKNLLANPGFDVNTTGWSGTGATLSRVTSSANAGLASASLSSTAGGTTSIQTPSGTSGVAVSASTVYAATAYVLAATTARSATLTVNWYTTAGTSTGTPLTFSINDANTNWTKLSVSGTSPALAAFAQVQVSFASTSTGEVHDIDDIMLSADSSRLTSLTYTHAQSTNDRLLVQSRTDVLASKTTTYSYDALDRLSRALTTAGTDDYQYVYDGNGNRTQQTINGTVKNLTYNNANELTSGTTTPVFDNNGNMTTGPTNTAYAYNSKNQTTSITPSGGSALTMNYADADSTRRTAAGSTKFVNSAFGIDSQTTSGTTTYTTRDSSGALVGMRICSCEYYFLMDGLGSIIGAVDATGTRVATFSYDPYGNVLTATGTQAANTTWRFAAGYYDSSTSHYKFGTRYYDPSIGRWAQQDPVAGAIASPDVVDRFLYAGDSPTNFVDPDGRDLWGTLGQVTGDVLGGVSGFLSGPLIADVATYALVPIFPEIAIPVLAASIFGAAVGAGSAQWLGIDPFSCYSGTC
jgi:RHS repeat-associated protein